MRNIKILIAVLILSFISNSLYAQDIIFFKDGTKDTVKVLEIGVELISYKKFKRLDGPLYKVKKEEVILIEFEDGTIEIIKAPKKETNIFSKYPVLEKRNILTINTFGLLLTNIHLGYERISAKGNFGVKVNAALSPIFLEDEGLAILGADFNFYPFGQKRINYFLGPALRLASFRDIPFVAAVFNNGFSYTTQKGLFIGSQLGFGPAMVIDDEILPYGFFMLNIGKRF